MTDVQSRAVLHASGVCDLSKNHATMQPTTMNEDNPINMKKALL